MISLRLAGVVFWAFLGSVCLFATCSPISDSQKQDLPILYSDIVPKSYQLYRQGWGGVEIVGNDKSQGSMFITVEDWKFNRRLRLGGPKGPVKYEINSITGMDYQLIDPSTKQAPVHFSLAQKCQSNWQITYFDCAYHTVVGQFTGPDGLVYLWQPVQNGFECVRLQLSTLGTSEVRVAHFKFPSIFALRSLGELNILELVSDEAIISLLLATSWIMDRELVRKSHVAWGVTAATTLFFALAEVASNQQYSSDNFSPSVRSRSRRSSRNRLPSYNRVPSTLSQPSTASAASGDHWHSSSASTSPSSSHRSPPASSTNIHWPLSSAPSDSRPPSAPPAPIRLQPSAPPAPIRSQPHAPPAHRVLVVNPDNSFAISEPLTRRPEGITALPNIQAHEIPLMP